MLGHKQGASLATGLTAVKDARNLYDRMWLTGGAGNLETVSLEAAQLQYDAFVGKICSDPSRHCLVDVSLTSDIGYCQALCQFSSLVFSLKIDKD